MGVRKDDLTQYIQQLETLKADIPAIMSKIAAGEGAYAVKQARLICKNDNVIGAGAYRRNWQSDKAAKRSRTPLHRPILQSAGLCQPPGVWISEPLCAGSLGGPYLYLWPQ